MKVLTRLPTRPLRLSRPVAAIGLFDGVHLGHRAILSKAVRRARAIRGTPVAVTFYPHPLAVLAPARLPPALLCLDQRLARFQALGIRLTLVVPFTRSFSRWTPEAFARRLLAGWLGAREVVVGHDFGFGAGRAGNVRTLLRLGRELGFRVHAVRPVRQGGVRVSSRRIRQAIQRGRLGQAARALGAPATCVGRVVHGAGRGAKIGYPTANLRIEAGVLPPPGVYAAAARIVPNPPGGRGVTGRSSSGRRGGRWRPGMANLGVRPTFGDGGKPLLEVHLLEGGRRLYGKRMETAFLRRLRAERRFSGPGALRRQLERDRARAGNVKFFV